VEFALFRNNEEFKMKIRNLLMAVWGAMVLTSCFTPKTVAYFPDLENGETLALSGVKGITLKPTDKLSIIVNTKSAELNNVLNLPVTSQIIGYSEVQSTNQSRGTSGYTIDPEGFIDFPLVGKVKAAGLTRAELAEHLKRTMEEKSVAKDAVVTVEYLNLGFSVIGEVKEPGFYKIESDRTTLMQALSRAGDMTIYGDRNKVKVLRINQEGKQDTYVLSMMDAEALMKSPAYIIQQNDVIYVTPNNYRKRQSANANDTTNGSFWISVVSVLTTIAVLLFK
jgi:polysaccharide export outer membrane protein